MQRTFITALMAMCLTGSLMAAIVVEETKVLEPSVVKKGRIKKKVVADFKFSGKKKFIKHSNKVIPLFKLTFLTNSKYVNSFEGSKSGPAAASAKQISTLTGIDEATCQQITESMYQDFVERLRAQGYEVMAPAEVSSKTYNKMKDVLPQKKGYIACIPKGTRYPGKIMDFSGAVARDTGALVVKGDYYVNFVITKRNEKKFSVGPKEKMWVSQGITIGGQLVAHGPDGLVSVQIQQPIYSQKSFGTLTDTTTGARKVGNAVKTGLKVLSSGLGSRSQTKTLSMAADASEYESAVVDALRQANEKLAQQLKDY